MTLYGYARVSVREPEDKNLDLTVSCQVRPMRSMATTTRVSPPARRLSRRCQLAARTIKQSYFLVERVLPSFAW